MSLEEILIQYKDSPIALYGLGAETEKVLAKYDPDFQIVGLLDGFRESGSIYGKRIIPLSKAAEYGVKLILVVARPGSCRAIVKRIRGFCDEKQIALFDMRGRNLLLDQKAAYHFSGSDGVTRAQLLQAAYECDAVSFDLFDTLVMRRTLFPADVAEYVEAQLHKRGIHIEGFCEQRIRAEKEMAGSRPPFLEEIYASVLKHVGEAPVTAQELADLEWETDCALCVARTDMVDIVLELRRAQKPVYIVTDTYYDKKRLSQLLRKCGIPEDIEILPSCECGTDKAHGLFERLIASAGTTCILHIGDDAVADIESAEQSSIRAIRIYSGLDLLEKLGYMGLGEHTDSIQDRLKIGMFTAKVFNTPFWFEMEKMPVILKTAYDIGYAVMAPMMTDFVIWLAEQVRQEGLHNIWFSARDGWLVKQMYDVLGETSVVGSYFLTSRKAAIRAGMETEADIEYVADMNFSGTLQQQLKSRFGIEVTAEETEEKELADFKELIFERSKHDRKNYLTYIDSLTPVEGNVAYFDFVAKGTTQLYVERMTGLHFKGLYFQQVEKKYMESRKLDIVSFYNDGEQSAIYEDYTMWEPILSSDKPSVEGFDESGNVIWTEDMRSVRDIACTENVRQGILAYFKTYVQFCRQPEEGIDKRVDELFLSLIHKLKVVDDDFIGLEVEDSFFGRTINMADLL